MGKLETLKANGSDPSWWAETAAPWAWQRLKRAPIDGYGRLYYLLRGIEFVSLPEADWDNLFLLDACRYDVFEQHNTIDGTLNRAYSRASFTPGFLRANFEGRTLHDTVYVTANPHAERQVEEDTFHDVFHVWRTHWDDDIKTVHPEAVQAVALRANEQYPNKRLLVHFMQPHAPFIGPWGREHVGIFVGNEHSRQGALVGGHNLGTDNPYAQLRRGAVSKRVIKRAYVENFELALRYIEPLVDAVVGKTVISADHGELFGERAWPYPWRGYQHPPLPAKDLRKVPWHVIDRGERKSVTAEAPTSRERDERTDIEQKLRHLGYKT